MLEQLLFRGLYYTSKVVFIKTKSAITFAYKYIMTIENITILCEMTHALYFHLHEELCAICKDLLIYIFLYSCAPHYYICTKNDLICFFYLVLLSRDILYCISILGAEFHKLFRFINIQPSYIDIHVHTILNAMSNNL